MTAPSTDAVGALRWGLRRYWWIVLACVVVGGVVGPVATLYYEAPLDAEALVIAQQVDMNPVALPRYGEAVFNNGAVAQAVAQNFGDLGESESIIPDRVSLIAEQDSIVFTVVGHDINPETAADIANIAATAFIEALNQGGVGVGTFALQSPAEPPGDPGVPGGLPFGIHPLGIPIGLAGGLLLGLAVVSSLLVIRRPVIDESDAEAVTGVRTLGTVTVPRVRSGDGPRSHQFAGLVPVCRRLVTLPTPIVVLASRPREEALRKQITLALASVLRRVGDVELIGQEEPATAVGEEPGRPSAPRPKLRASGSARRTLVDSSDLTDLVQPPDRTVTVLVAPEGISTVALRDAVVEHLGGSAEARLILVKQRRRLRSVGGVPSASMVQPRAASASR